MKADVMFLYGCLAHTLELIEQTSQARCVIIIQSPVEVKHNLSDLSAWFRCEILGVI